MRFTAPLLIAAAALAASSAAAQVPPPAGLRPPTSWADCGLTELDGLRRNPSAAELRCRFAARGPGKFGLLSYLDVPVYRPATPLPGTHTVGIPGMPHPAPGESFEQWEWRVLRSSYGPEARRVHNDLMQLDPVFMSMIRRFERELAQAGVRARRRETYRAAERQAYLFQQGRSRPGGFVTSTLTSWHCRVDRLGRPAARAADYDVAPSQLARFHDIAKRIGMEGYGADSNDPGHVYLPDTDAATGTEVAALRTLARVQHVTLATGRPEGEWQAPGALARWRQRTVDFIRSPVPAYPAWYDPAVQIRPMMLPLVTDDHVIIR